MNFGQTKFNKAKKKSWGNPLFAVSTLANLAEQIGLDKTAFIKDIQSDAINALLMAEINAARSLPIQGFPSLVLENKGEYHVIPVNYHDWEASYQQILSLI